MKREALSVVFWGVAVVALAGCRSSGPVSAQTDPLSCRSVSEPTAKDARRVWFETIDRLLACASRADREEQSWALRSRAARLAGRLAKMDGWMGWECRRLAASAELDQDVVCPKPDRDGEQEGDLGRQDSAGAIPASPGTGRQDALPRLQAGVAVPPIPPAGAGRPGPVRAASGASRNERRPEAQARGSMGVKSTFSSRRFDPDRWIFGDLLDVPLSGPAARKPVVAAEKKGAALRFLGIEGLSGRILTPFVETVKKPVTPRFIRCSSGPDRFHLLLSLRGPVRYSGGIARASGSRPNRLYLDIAGLDLQRRDIKKLSRCAGGIVSSLRIGRRGPGVRIVFDVPAKARFLVYFRRHPFRLVADFRSRLSGVAGPVKVVALDPGHGGSSRGAVGPGGLEEKVVALAIARQAARVLRRAGIKVVLTRSGDQDRSLGDRTALALAEGADLFVSIHANSDGRGRRQAVETYFLDLADGDFSRRLAMRENDAAGARVDRRRLALAGAMEAARTAESRRLAGMIQVRVLGAVRRFLPETEDGRVRRALFAVLLTARVPAVLTEVSYISHPGAEKVMARKAFQDAVGRAIAGAVLAYKNEVTRKRLSNHHVREERP